MKYDFLTNVLGNEPLLSRSEWMHVVHSVKDSWKRQKDSTLLKALETGVLRVSESPAAKNGMKKSDIDRIGVTFQCASFGSNRAAEAYTQSDSCALSDKDIMSVQYTAVFHQSKNSCISGMYEYDTKCSHNASWQALVDLHPKVGFEIHHGSETGDVETSIDVGPLILGASVEYHMTQFGKFQKARVYRKHHQTMSSSLSFSAASTGGEDRTMKAQIFKKKKKENHSATSGIGSNGNVWYPQIDLAYTKASPPPSSSSAWRLDHIGFTQSLAHICNINTQASIKCHRGTRPRTLIDLSHGFADDSLFLSVSSEIADGAPAFTFKAKHQKRKDQRIIYQMSLKPKREGDSLGFSIKAKYPRVSFSVQGSRGDIRGKFYHECQ